MIDLFDCLGLLGVALSIYAYGCVQWHRDYAKTLAYSVLNFFGSSFIAISLLNKWNLASFIGNITWVLISIYGILRCLKYRRRKKTV